MLTAPSSEFREAARPNVRAPEDRPVVAVVGKECVGKSQLAAGLTGRAPSSQNFRGSTVAVERFRAADRDFVDTPGILRESDTETTRLALEELSARDTVLLAVQATHLDDDLRDLLPLTHGKRGAVVVTYWDKVAASGEAADVLRRMERDAGVLFVPVDARRLSDDDRRNIVSALDAGRRFARPQVATLAGWRIEPRPGLFERPWVGPLSALSLLVLPALLTIFAANVVADCLHPLVERALAPLVACVEAGPQWLRLPLLGAEDARYGLLTMGPFLFVWAAPTVALYAVVLGGYKASGLVERISLALEPLTRPFGLTGRDVVRVLIGLGCNVPAVIGTRGCSRCSRGPAMAAIAFGAACSYQLPATLAVFAAAGRPGLAFPFLAWLGLTTLVYLRLTSSAEARSPLNALVIRRRTFLVRPSWNDLWREARGTISQFLFTALPVFAVICLAASALDALGAIRGLSRILEPAMAAFRLPASAAAPIVFATIRKDGLLLLVNGDAGVIPGVETAGQLLTATYLGGVLAPCLVTALTIAREESWRFALALLARQAGFALFFSLVLAWSALLWS